MVRIVREGSEERKELVTKNQENTNEAGGVRRQEKAWRKVVHKAQGDRLCQQRSPENTE